MTTRIRRTGLALAAAAALLTTGLTGLAPAAAASAHPSTPKADRTAPEVHLITGDAVRLRTASGRQGAVVLMRAASGPASSYSGVSLAGDAYVFPAVAKPYLGTVLDPALFDVSAQSRALSARTRVHLAFASGAKPHVPGLTLTSSTATSAAGYFTAASARAFGDALAKAYPAAAAARTAPRTLFGVTRITSDAAPARTKPAFVQKTLVVKGTGADGLPIPFALFLYLNTDDGNKAAGIGLIVDGEARVSVPVGHYSLLGEDDAFDTATRTVDSRIATIQDASVRTGGTTLALDFRKATARPSVALPRPAGLDELDLAWTRADAQGNSFSASFGFGPGDAVRVAPAPQVKIGSEYWETDWHEHGTEAGAKTPYRYDVSFVDRGLIKADQSHRLTAAKLATIAERFYSDDRRRGSLFGRGAIFPFTGFAFIDLFPFHSPLARTDYVSAPSDGLWNDAYIGLYSEADSVFGQEIDDGLRAHPFGSTDRAEWQRPLLAPSTPTTTADDPFKLCVYCRSAGEMAIELSPVQDSFRDGHYGSLDGDENGDEPARMRLYRDGKLIDDEDYTFVDAKVPAGTHQYRVVAETSPGTTGLRIGTHAVTTYTFSSAAGSGSALPKGWECFFDSCTVLPLLRVVAPLPTDLTDVMPLGSHGFDFSVAPAQNAASTTVTAGLAVSFDAGRTFSTVPVTALGGDRFRAVLTNPATSAGSAPTLRFTGRGADGSTITETVDAAYRVAAH